MVFPKVVLVKIVLRFGHKVKLTPRFIRHFKILEQIGPIAYKLALPPSLSCVHDVFHVSMLRKYITNSMHVIDYKPLDFKEDLSYEEKQVQILA